MTHNVTETGLKYARRKVHVFDINKRYDGRYKQHQKDKEMHANFRWDILCRREMPHDNVLLRRFLFVADAHSCADSL